MSAIARYMRKGSPFSEPPTPPSFPPLPRSASPIPDIADDEDPAYTLTAFGDIDSTIDCFIPTLPGDAILDEDEEESKDGDSVKPIPPKAKTPPPATPKGRPRSASASRPRPPVLQPKPKKSEYALIVAANLASPGSTFDEAVKAVHAASASSTNLKDRLKQRIPPRIKVVPKSPTSTTMISSSLTGGGVSPETPVIPATPKYPSKTTTPTVAATPFATEGATGPAPIILATPGTPLKGGAPTTPKSPISPNSPKKPFRGYGPMPKRSPLPKWELIYPELAEKKNVVDTGKKDSFEKKDVVEKKGAKQKDKENAVVVVQNVVASF